MQGQLDNVVWGAGPKDKAVPRVSEPRLDLGILEPQQEGVEDELVILGRQEFLLLLGISSRAMGGIECLDLGLQSCQLSQPIKSRPSFRQWHWKQGKVSNALSFHLSLDDLHPSRQVTD